MSFFQFDENQAKSGFEPLPIGEYEVIVTKAEVKSSQAGNPMIALQLTVRDDVPQEGAKRKFFDNLVFTEAAMFKVHQFAGSVGIEDAADINDFAQQAMYKPARVKNKHETYQGKTNDKVNVYLPPQEAYEGNGGPQNDPFAGDGTMPDISDDDLPF